MRDERLAASFGAEAPASKRQIDAMLDAALNSPDDREISSWQAAELPSLSEVCRRKIESHVLHRIQH